MNEKIRKGQEMFAANQDMEAVIRTVMNHALLTRPERSVCYRPYEVCEGVGVVRALGAQKVNLDVRYPQAAAGDGVICDFNILCQTDETIYLNVTPNVKVWYHGLCIYDGIDGTVDIGERLPEERGAGRKHLPVCVKKGEDNPVRILCIKEAGKEFSYEFLISVKRYPNMWANDYLFGARAVPPLSSRRGEEGIALSGILKETKWRETDLGKAKISYQWPAALTQDESFDFHKLCGEGDVCYVYTEVKAAHELKYSGTVDRIWINGTEVSERNLKCSIAVDRGDKLLFKCIKRNESWRLSLDTTNLYLSFLTSKRNIGDKAVFAGPFYGEQCHGPEYAWDFAKVFQNHRGEQVYWRFCEGSKLRIYLDSVFFGQWFYALMVGFYGIRDAAIFLKDEERQRLFNRNMSFLAKYFDYIEYDLKKHVMSAFMPRLFEMDVLDNVGTMGMNLIDAYLDSNDRAILPLIERIRYQVEDTIPRMEDGTYYRVDTMWADDLYMSCPFLVRMGRLTGEKCWYEKAAKQIQGFKERLYMEDDGLFSHIYFPKEGKANRVPWGRGNGWVMWTLTELLMHGQEKADLIAEKELFYKMAHGIRKLQDESGLWHQVLNRTDEGSYLETSCTGMFLLAFTRGVKYGWLESDFLESMEKAWKGLLTNSIDVQGNVYGVCMGSGCAMEAEYYFAIPTIINDDHGTGVILAAAAEYCALLKELA